MFDFEKSVMTIYGFFVVILCIAFCLWLTVKLIEMVFWQLVLGVLIIALIAGLGWFLYRRFWRW